MSIRYFFVFAVLILCGCGTTQNYFEGKIIFEKNIKAKTTNIDTEKLHGLLGNGTILFFKRGNYYHQYLGGTYEYEIYNQTDNKSYLKKRNNDTIYWIDCSMPGKEILNFQFTEKKEKVLGIVCDQLKIQYKDNSQTHYYNADSIRTNPDWFKNFRRNGEYRIDEKEKSIFIKSENEFDKFIIISTATEIIRQPIDDAMFKIKENSILAKMK